LDLQNKVRQTVLQICGGIGFLWSIFMAVNSQISSNQDMKAKYDRETAELFIKAVESQAPEALFSLAYIARRDPKNYHETIFRMLASLITRLSPSACSQLSLADADIATKQAAVDKMESAKKKIQVAFQLLHERATKEDPEGATYN